MIQFDEEMDELSSTHFDDLPDAIVQCILGHMKNARDVAACNCVSRRWKDSTAYVRSLFFPRNSFDNGTIDPDIGVGRMILSTVWLEELIIYCPFSTAGLARWISAKSNSLRHLELRMDTLNEKRPPEEDPKLLEEIPNKLDCIGAAKGLESLSLWGVLMCKTPKWGVFQKLRSLQIVGARLNDSALCDTLRACPHVKKLSLLSCDGLRSISIELPQLEECRLDFYGQGDCMLSLSSSKVHLLDVQGCSWIRLEQNHRLRNLSVANNAGKVYKVDFGKLPALEFLSIRGVQWCWSAVSSILQSASEVKHLVMKIEFSGDSNRLQPFPEIDLVEFFNNHPEMQTFEIQGAMFAAMCQRNSLKNLDPKFTIPCLEEVLITVRSPLNAEQKMSTLDSILKYSTKLRKMVIRVSKMKNCHTSADDFFEEICRFGLMNRGIVQIE
ncbi:F-box protein At1g10780-like [Aristolochia californica]|uniref:F-box protein At1g10780-like n=1 Tax=Aristolochia californica TaxID=171875 RepID=UPI0035D9931C